MKKLFSFIISLVVLCGLGLNSIIVQAYTSCAQKEKEADLLYTKMQEFLSENKYLSYEQFEEACRKRILKDGQGPQILKEEDFKKKALNKLILYRGFDTKKHANALKKGKIFIGSIIHNQRGQGIYTSNMKALAKNFTNSYRPDYFENSNEDDKIVTMFFSKRAKILEFSYLEELIKIIKSKHKIKIKQKYDSNISNQDALFFNAGLLAKFLGYDIILSKYSEAPEYSFSDASMEYLIINSDILTICK